MKGESRWGLHLFATCQRSQGATVDGRHVYLDLLTGDFKNDLVVLNESSSVAMRCMRSS